MIYILEESVAFRRVKKTKIKKTLSFLRKNGFAFAGDFEWQFKFDNQLD